MWFKRKEKPKIKPWKDLIEERGTYGIDLECRVCGFGRTELLPKRCRPNNKAFTPQLGWYVRNGWNIVDEETDNYYNIGSCDNCGCNEMEPKLKIKGIS